MSEHDDNGCSNGDCKLRIGKCVGQHTNGPCQCLRSYDTATRIRIERKLWSLNEINADLLEACKAWTALLTFENDAVVIESDARQQAKATKQMLAAITKATEPTE